MSVLIEFQPKALHFQRVRMNDILRRHVRAEDTDLSDTEFVLAVFQRFRKSREDALIDPAE